MTKRGFICTLGVLTVIAMSAHAQEPRARATLKSADGKQVGTATLQQTRHGVLISAQFTGLPPGTHAFHIHGVGKCEPPFESAGPHFNPQNKQHGFEQPAGPHAGDLPNIHVPESGTLTVEVIAADASLTAGNGNLLDQDGAALVVHQGVDDYKTDPAGGAGPRIACGVIEKQ